MLKRDKRLPMNPSLMVENWGITGLNVEMNRLRTFDHWNVSFIDKHQLALLGFYYLGVSDMVKCYFCGVEIGLWETGDDILTDHMKWSPSCSLIRGHETDNVPLDQDLLNQTLQPIPPDVYGMIERTNNVSEGSIDVLSEDDVHMYQHQLYGQGGLDAFFRSHLSLSAPRPTLVKHVEYNVEAKRVESYKDWPKIMRQKPKILSDAGFYYTGKGDKVCCFSCSGVLKDWQENDDPWEQHAMWYGKCEYLNLMKESDFIEKMTQRREEISKISSKGGGSQNSVKESQFQSSSYKKLQELSVKADDQEDSKLCKICFNVEYNTIFLPCGHVIACGKCASSVSKCPACRQSFKNVMRVYFS
jgi:E3 ubiquitin-protein ligase XIAP